ncbi:MAG: hypothetical protein ABW106_10140 [Steroidobacteraceae bacterium]
MHTDIPRLLGLLIALAGGLFAAGSFVRRRHPTPGGVGAATSTGRIVYSDTPTVRVAKSQRVDRVRKLARLAAGEHFDVLENHGIPVPRFRVTVKSIGERAGSPTAHILVSYGGTQVSCGPAVEEVASNEFILPLTKRDDPRTTVFHFHERGDALDFMRVRLRGIDADGAAEIDLMQVSGNWLKG